MRVSSDYAVVMGKPVRLDGGRIDYSGTKYAGMIEQQAFDEHVFALLKKVGGRWRVLEHEIGRTDYIGDEWVAKYGVASSLVAPP